MSFQCNIELGSDVNIESNTFPYMNYLRLLNTIYLQDGFYMMKVESHKKRKVKSVNRFSNSYQQTTMYFI